VYTPPRAAANAYAKVGLESGIVAASPHQLIVLLYEGAELAVRMAIRHIADGDLPQKAAAITKAGNIIHDGLRAALDMRQGGDLALQLDALYDYMNKRLMLAHVSNQTAPLEEVLGLLRELRQAWLQIGATARAAQSVPHSVAA
jgi:flagellar protein FliS